MPISWEVVQSVLVANRAQQERARKLNLRAGENLFPVLTEDQATEWMVARLRGARCVAEVPDPEALRFDPLDEALAALVAAENPDAVEIGGVTIPIMYTESGPRASLDCSGDAADLWRSLPESELRLPGGHAVAVAVKFGWYDTTEHLTDLAALRRRIRDRVNRQAWDRWQKPAIEIPDFSNEGVSVPELREEVFGTDPVTDEPLIAFGAVRFDDYWHSEYRSE